MVDGRDVRPRGPEAERPMTHHLHLVVHALERAVGDPELRPGQDAIQVRANRLRQLSHGEEPGVGSAPEPLAQVPFRPRRVAVGPEPAEVLLEQVGLHDGGVQPEEAGEAGRLVAPEVRGILQPEEPSPRAVRLLRLGQLPPHLPAHGVHRLGGVLREMEPVEDHGGRGHGRPDHREVGPPHGAADDLDGAGAALPQPGEEVLERGFIPIFPHPDHAAALAIGAQGEGLLPLPPAHLVDPHGVEGGPPAGGQAPADGRPPRRIRPNPSAVSLVGVEINILQSRVMLVGIDGTAHSKREIHLNARANPTRTLTMCLEATKELVGEAGVDHERILGIGVSFRGAVDRERGIINRTISLPEWDRLNVVEPLQEQFSWPVFAENNAMALGEARFGVGRGKKNILVLIVEEGIGGGIIINGQLYVGQHSAAGELGHMTIIPSGPTCHCGNRGCLRTLASESAIESNAIRTMKSGATSLLNEQPEADRLRITAQDVVEAAEKADAVCEHIILDAARHLGICLVNVANILSPEMIILNESPLTTYKPFLLEIERMFGEAVYARRLGSPEIAISSLHENGVCVGAACSVMDRLLAGNLSSLKTRNQLPG